MKVLVLAENIKKALSLVKATMPKPRSTLPILNCVKIATDNKRLMLVSTNLEAATKVWVGAKVIEDGATAVSYTDLADLTKMVKKGQTRTIDRWQQCRV